jgi:hypothetical protein
VDLRIKELFSENWFVAVLPVVGFMVALAFDYGYASYFGFPYEIIQIDLKRTLIATAACFAFSMYIVVYLEFVRMNLVKRHYAARIIANVLTFGLLPFILCVVTGFEQTSIKIFIASISVSAAYYFVRFLLSLLRKETKDLLVELLDDEETESDGIPLLRAIGGVFVLMLIGASVCAGAGKWFASARSNFSAFDYKNSSYIVVAIYNETIVAVELDKKSKTRSKNSIFVDVKSDEISPFYEFKLVD